MSNPAGLQIAPLTSETATTFAPARCSSLAELAPTLPKPWMATVLSGSSRPRRFNVSRVMNRSPRPVASTRPPEPPSATGLPVTTPGST